MDNKEWESLKTGDRVKRFFEGAGTIIAICGVGVVVKFDNGITKRITDGRLKKLKHNGCIYEQSKQNKK